MKSKVLINDEKLLYVLLVIEITLTVVAFFMLLPASLFAAIFLSGLNALSLVPIIAIINNINTIDDPNKRKKVSRWIKYK